MVKQAKCRQVDSVELFDDIFIRYIWGDYDNEKPVAVADRKL